MKKVEVLSLGDSLADLVGGTWQQSDGKFEDCEVKEEQFLALRRMHDLDT